VQQVYRIWADQSFIELEQTIGPIPIKDGLGKEIITRFVTNLSSSETWYTDSQGTEFQQRKLNYRPTWNLTVEEPVAGNYFPIDIAIYIQDVNENLQLTVVNDRSDGGCSLEDGELELMVHRRLLVDDGRGVGEPLNESTTIRTTKKVYINTIDTSKTALRNNIVAKAHPVELTFGQPINNPNDWIQAGYVLDFTPLANPLPTSAELLSFEFQSFDGKKLMTLVRLHNIYALSENPANVTVDLSTMFTNLQPTEITEMGMTGTVKLKDIPIIRWNTTASRDDEYSYPEPQPENDYQINLTPMQIRTFQVGWSITN